MLKGPFCPLLSMILTGFIKIGHQMDVICGKKFIVVISFGIKCPLIILWELLKNSSQVLEKLHRHQNVHQQSQLFDKLLINTGMVAL